METIGEPEMHVLIIDHEIRSQTPRARMLKEIIACLSQQRIRVLEAVSAEEGRSSVIADPSLTGVLVSWDLEEAGEGAESPAGELITRIRRRTRDLPIFIFAERTDLPTIPIEIIREINEYVWLLEDTPDFIAGRVAAAARIYRKGLLPPFFRDLIHFSRVHEYSWHTPGHTGGTAFLKSPSGRLFHSFFGEELFRSDLSISVGELGSLLDHSGSVGEAERFAATVFGADSTYFVTNGTSTSNKIVFFGCVTPGDNVLVDRNCHKSIEHAITMTHGVPVYMVPTRNRYGIIGPIPQKEMKKHAVEKKIKDCPFTGDSPPALAVVTNSTYDGLCYDATLVESILGESVDRLHFDEAWYAYARFNPLYAGRFGMHDRDSRDGPTVFATQSTHKLLAALSQASMIHIREGRVPVEHERFNEAFMMHTSTSPLYPVIASCDVSAKMMSGASGRVLTQESINEAVSFRKTMASIGRTIFDADERDWWFPVWQPETVTLPGGRKVEFADASDEELSSDPAHWILHPGDEWHGFGDIADGYCMLDPIKVTVLTPGVATDGTLEASGIPADIVTRFLDSQGTVAEKTGPYSILFLFSMGVTKGKWGTLIAELFEFKQFYDENIPVIDAIPTLAGSDGFLDEETGLADFCTEMHEHMKRDRMLDLLAAAFETLPDAVMTPTDAYRHVVRGTVDRIRVDDMAGRIAAVGIVPYPPGIPVLMPGEHAGDNYGPILSYLRALEAFDDRFPGFGHDIHGVEATDGVYYTYAVREDE